MPPKEWIPLAVLAQLYVYYRRENCWPTVQQLAVFTELPVDRVKSLLDVLLDRRLVQLDGETVYPWEAGPSPVVTYRLSPEEIAARYGPPNRPTGKPQVTEEAENMPKGVYIAWPPAAELVAMANEIQERGGNVLGELAERFACSTFTIKKQLRQARRAILQTASKEVGGAVEATAQGEPGPVNAPTTAPADEEAGETMSQHVNWPDPHTLVRMADELTAEGRSAAAVIAARLGVHPGTVRKKLHEARQALAATPARDEAGPSSEATAGEPGPGEAPSSGELMQMAEEEASWIIETTVAAPEPRSVDQGTPTLPEEETASSGPQDAPAVDDLDTFHALILVSPTEVRTELVHVTMAPTAHADEWPEIVRVDGRQQVRVWTCVGVQRVGDHPVAVMIPKGYAVVRVRDVHERRTA